MTEIDNAGPATPHGTSLTVTRTINATAGRIFDVLASPHRHPEIDASRTVRSDDNASPVTRVGQVFRMNMVVPSADGEEEYQTDNHVHAYQPNSCIGWQVADVDEDPLGWAWRFDLRPHGDHKTDVTLTYDWSAATPAVVAEYDVPHFGEADLAASLDLLATAAGKG
jgi:hypothetical protein